MDEARTLRLIGPTGVIAEHSLAHGGGAAFTDEELTALALAADPHAPLEDDAVPISAYLGATCGPLPDWYMPAVTGRAHRWRWPVVVPLVFAFMLIAGFGLCGTYGFLSIG